MNQFPLVVGQLEYELTDLMVARFQQVAAVHPLLPASQVCILANARHGIAFSHASPCAEAFLAFAVAQSGSTSTPETQ